jgi:hypothetical protein
MPESDKLYHADVVAVEQNFGQLDVTLGGITKNNVSFNPYAI